MSTTTQTRPRSRFRRGAVLAATTLALVGGALAIAPTASAVDSSGCNSAWYYLNGHINTNGVNLRSGPSTRYSSKGVLSKGTRTYIYCYRDSSKDAWDYIKVTSGANKGVKGWVRHDLNNWW
ncbi:SH3 domain-containing protein [Streptomyces sp. NPDC058145]|uniref:SH3 domain-containing protein n=1 Tax=Streptomyces sp. NPDC058145 TaxID=3346356 RepID=UPI0036F01FA0